MRPRIKEMIRWSLMSSMEHVQNRKNSSEIYGYDFCIDEQWGVWLIEINSSPSFDFSSDVTERLVKMASEDYIKVIVDYGGAKREDRPGVDTGKFQCIYKSPICMGNAKEAMGVNLALTGKGIDAATCKQMGRLNI